MSTKVLNRNEIMQVIEMEPTIEAVEKVYKMKSAGEAVAWPTVFRSFEEGVRDMETADFDRYLVTAGIPDPDLLIRPSGEQRISNYLLWQCAYTEFVFTDVLWPDFRKPEFRAALETYASRDRRYGKVK